MFWNWIAPLPLTSLPLNCKLRGLVIAKFPLSVVGPSTTDPEEAVVEVCVAMKRVAPELTFNCPLTVKFSGMTARVPCCIEIVEPVPDVTFVAVPPVNANVPVPAELKVPLAAMVRLPVIAAVLADVTIVPPPALTVIARLLVTLDVVNCSVPLVSSVTLPVPRAASPAAPVASVPPVINVPPA